MTRKEEVENNTKVLFEGIKELTSLKLTQEKNCESKFVRNRYRTCRHKHNISYDSRPINKC